MQQFLILSFAFIFLLSGCSEKLKEPTKSIVAVDSDSNVQSTFPSDHFANHYKSMTIYLDWVKKGKELRTAEKYDEALKEFLSLNEYLSDKIVGRGQRTGAFLEIAKTYEAMGDYAKAIEYYDKASEMIAPMNVEGGKAHKAKADALRKKIGLPISDI